MDNFTTVASRSGISQGETTNNSQISGNFSCLSLGLQLIMTIMILLMSGWVVFTIKTTRNLHKSHNIFIANLLVSGIVGSFLQLSFSGVMAIGYAIGVDNLHGCYIKQFLSFPIMVVNFSAVMISTDKVIAIEFPFKHRKVMTCHAVGNAIITSWGLAILLSVDRIFLHYNDLAEYDNCVSLVVANRSDNVIVRVLPLALSSLFTISVNIYLSFKAYKIHKQIQKETKLSGDTVTFKKKLAKLKKDVKPILTLLMVLFGSSLAAKVFILVLNLSTHLFSHQTTKEVNQALNQNLMFMVFFIHPIVYGFYFKQIRQPMVRKLKSLFVRNKFHSAVVAPMPVVLQRN